jgi:RNA polymerase binding protein RbpA
MRWSSIRASRLSGPGTGEVDRGGALAERREVLYWCATGHVSTPHLAADIEPPEQWECSTCGAPSSRSMLAPPPTAPRSAFHKTPYEFLMMRRTAEEGEALLEEALTNLRSRRQASR